MGLLDALYRIRFGQIRFRSFAGNLPPTVSSLQSLGEPALSLVAQPLKNKETQHPDGCSTKKSIQIVGRRETTHQDGPFALCRSPLVLSQSGFAGTLTRTLSAHWMRAHQRDHFIHKIKNTADPKEEVLMLCILNHSQIAGVLIHDDTGCYPVHDGSFGVEAVRDAVNGKAVSIHLTGTGRTWMIPSNRTECGISCSRMWSIYILCLFSAGIILIGLAILIQYLLYGDQML